MCGKTSDYIIYADFYHRLTPKNLHQRPTVALLCGPHVQGAQGISCGRHLANHEVEVVLFLPNFVKMLEAITSELALFGKTGGKQVSSVKGTGAIKHVASGALIESTVKLAIESLSVFKYNSVSTRISNMLRFHQKN